jgi:hypothetical protein
MDTQALRGARNPAGDFASIGNQQSIERRHH